MRRRRLCNLLWPRLCHVLNPVRRSTCRRLSTFSKRARWPSSVKLEGAVKLRQRRTHRCCPCCPHRRFMSEEQKEKLKVEQEAVARAEAAAAGAAAAAARKKGKKGKGAKW